jgi:hypothetical protein
VKSEKRGERVKYEKTHIHLDVTRAVSLQGIRLDALCFHFRFSNTIHPHP